jgi:hypothetical protein
VLEKSTALSRLQMEYTATTISSEEDRQDRLKLCETVSTLEEKVTELRSGHIKVVAVADAQLRMLSERFLQVLKHEGISLQDWHSGAVASKQTLAQQDLLKLLSLLPAEGKGTMKPSSSTKVRLKGCFALVFFPSTCNLSRAWFRYLDIQTTGVAIDQKACGPPACVFSTTQQ